MADLRISQLAPAQSLNKNAMLPIIQADPADGIFKNYSVSADQFMIGVKLLGKLTGANMNLAGTGTITYTAQTGLAFQIGDTVTDAISMDSDVKSITTVLTNDGSTMTISGIPGNSGLFAPGHTINGTMGLINFLTGTGTFQPTEIVTGGSSEATANVISINTDQIIIEGITGTFTEGETVTGRASGATCIVTSYEAPASATVSSSVFSGGDQVIVLIGGSTYIVTDVVITNASTPLTNVAGGSIYSGENETGNLIASVNGTFGALTSPSYFFNGGNGINLLPDTPSLSPLPGMADDSTPSSTCSSPLYFSVQTAQGSSATADIYVYGYILN